VNLMGTPFKQAYRTNPIDGDQGGVELVPITERFEFSLVSCNMATNEGIYRCSAELGFRSGQRTMMLRARPCCLASGSLPWPRVLRGARPRTWRSKNLLPNGTATTMMDPDRPAIIMGDFNIDGATLNLKVKTNTRACFKRWKSVLRIRAARWWTTSSPHGRPTGIGTLITGTWLENEQDRLVRGPVCGHRHRRRASSVA